jgi:hypothetical protein
MGPHPKQRLLGAYVSWRLFMGSGLAFLVSGASLSFLDADADEGEKRDLTPKEKRET